MGGGALNFGGTAGRPPPPNAPPAHLAGSMSGVLKSSYRTREPCAWAGTLTSAVPQSARATPPRITIISIRENARRGKLFKAATLILSDSSGTTSLYLSTYVRSAYRPNLGRYVGGRVDRPRPCQQRKFLRVHHVELDRGDRSGVQKQHAVPAIVLTGIRRSPSGHPMRHAEVPLEA